MVSGPRGNGGDDAEPRSSTAVAVGAHSAQQAKRFDAMDGPCKIPRAKGVCVGQLPAYSRSLVCVRSLLC
eukprot:185006-Alexandrium_andersonii.AAC.1